MRAAQQAPPLVRTRQYGVIQGNDCKRRKSDRQIMENERLKLAHLAAIRNRGSVSFRRPVQKIPQVRHQLLKPRDQAEMAIIKNMQAAIGNEPRHQSGIRWRDDRIVSSGEDECRLTVRDRK